jgi:hypothetical protein
MSVTIEWNELLRWAPLFVPAAVLCFIWFRRRRKEKEEFGEAESCLKNGLYVDCLDHLSKADENWRFNAANSTPKTVVQDIDRLVAMVELIGLATAQAGTHCDTADLLVALKEYRAIYSDKKHFRFGSFTLKSESAARAEQLAKDIGERRVRLRACYMSVLQATHGVISAA